MITYIILLNHLIATDVVSMQPSLVVNAQVVQGHSLLALHCQFGQSVYMPAESAMIALLRC